MNEMNDKCTCYTGPPRWDDPPLIPDEDCPAHGDPRILAGQDTDDTRREDEPGDWFIAGFDSECSRDCPGITEGDTIRADGAGGWECQGCVDEDDEGAYFDLAEENRQAAS